MSRIFIDTAPFIYLFERNDELHNIVYEQFENWFNSNAVLLTSVLTLSEILVHPKSTQHSALEHKYKYLMKDMLSDPLIVIDEEIADRAAWFRVEYKLKTPDAIQLAAALQTGCDIFYSNDKNLKKVKELQVLICE